MVANVTHSVNAAVVDARVYTLLVPASQVDWTFAVLHALWFASTCRAFEEVWKACADRPVVNHLAQRVWTAWVGVAWVRWQLWLWWNWKTKMKQLLLLLTPISNINSML